jgi:hypothetical protein
MKGIFILCGTILVAALVFLGIQLAKPDRYGSEFQGAGVVDVKELLASPEKYLGKPVRVEGIVRKQCQSTGCYFFFQAGDDLLRIELGDVVSSLPKREGFFARVEGELGKYGNGYQLYGRAVEFTKNR